MFFGFSTGDWDFQMLSYCVGSWESFLLTAYVCLCVSGGRSKVQTGVWSRICGWCVVSVGGVVRMLSNLRRGRLTEEQEVFTPTSSPGPSLLPLSTQLGRLSSRECHRSCRLIWAPLLSSSLSWAAQPALSLFISLHQSKPRVASLPGHARWRRRAFRSSTAQSIPFFLPARILPKQSGTCASCFPIALPCTITWLQPASTGRQEASQSRSRKSWRRGKQKVGLHQSGGFTYKKVSETEQHELTWFKEQQPQHEGKTEFVETLATFWII